MLKCTEGNAWGDKNDHSLAHYKSDLGMHEVSIERGRLNEIIRDRLADIFEHIRERIPTELLQRRAISVYLTGGTSLMRGIDELAFRIFGVPVYPPPALEGDRHAYLHDPRYCTAIGLIRYAQRYDDSDIFPSNRNMLARILDFFRGRR